MIIDMGHWVSSTPLPDGGMGFVYIITHIGTGHYYIGQKVLSFTRKIPPLKGYKRKRKMKKDSGWSSYTGSSTQLNEDIARLGKEQFTFRIVMWCKSKNELNYEEAKLQFKNDVLHDELSYNSWIHCRCAKFK